MRTASIADVKARLSSYIDQARGGPVIVTRHGRPTAILVRAPEDPDDLERFLIANSPVFQAIIADARKSEGIPHDELWRSLEARRGRATRTEKLRSRGRVASKRRKARGSRKGQGES